MNYDELMSIKIIPKEIAKSQSKAFVNGLHHTHTEMKFAFFRA